MLHSVPVPGRVRQESPCLPLRLFGCDGRDRWLPSRRKAEKDRGRRTSGLLESRDGGEQQRRTARHSAKQRRPEPPGRLLPVSSHHRLLHAPEPARAGGSAPCGSAAGGRLANVRRWGVRGDRASAHGRRKAGARPGPGPARDRPGQANTKSPPPLEGPPVHGRRTRDASSNRNCRPRCAGSSRAADRRGREWRLRRWPG